jgi:hypothetical protein
MRNKATYRPTPFVVTLAPVHRSPSWARRFLPVLVLFALAVATAVPASAQEPDPSVPPVDPPAPTLPDPSAGDPTVGTTEPPDGEPPPEAAPPGPPPLDPSPHVRVLLAHFAIFDARDALALERLVLAEAEERVAAADLAAQRAEQQLDAEEASLERAQADLRNFSVGMFIHANGGMSTGTEADQFGEFEMRKAEQLTDSVREHRLTMVEDAEDRIDDARRVLDERRADAMREAEVAAERRLAVDEASVRLRDAEQELRVAQRNDVLLPYERDPDDEGELDDESQERRRDGQLASDTGPKRQWELRIQGASVFTPDELAAWFATFQVMPTRARAPSADLARWFVEEGAAEGLRGDVAFAQAILETGSFTNLDTVDHNNYAGIGHCDSCPSGWTFDTPQLGVRAQIQLLKSYVFEQPEYVNDLVDRRLRGPAGCCQTWSELSGVWASAGGYSAHIMRIYQQMLEWLYQRRTGSPPPAAPGPAA